MQMDLMNAANGGRKNKLDSKLDRFETGETSYYYCKPTRPVADDEPLADENYKTYVY